MVTVIAVRHADIDLPPHDGDPALNAAGRARTALLARTLSDASVVSILVSSRKRTQETAAPLATHLGLDPEVVDTPAAVAQKIRQGGYGPVLLIVGHSNTIPELIVELGAGPAPGIGETEFDNLYVVTVHGSESEVLHLRYGTAVPEDR